MQLKQAIEQKKQELLKDFREAIYVGCELVEMTSTSTTSDYLSEQVDFDNIRVEPIHDRFTEIDGTIKAVKVLFEIKRPRKRKYELYDVYYKINK